MAHLFHVVDLENDCMNHLKMGITDENVLAMWKNGEKYQSKILTVASFRYFVERLNKIPLNHIPGFDYLEKPQLVDLVTGLCEENRFRALSAESLLGSEEDE